MASEFLKETCDAVGGIKEARYPHTIFMVNEDTTMKTKQTESANPNPNVRATLVRLSTEIAEALEDYRYHQQREKRRRVTKRELIEQALEQLIRSKPTTR